MKIFLLTVGIVNYNCNINFFEPLKEMGFNVFRYNYLERLNRLGKKGMNQELLFLVERKKPDYIFFITYKDEVSKNTLRRLKEKNIKVIAWFSDDHWRFEDYSKYIAREICCSITTDSKAFEKYKECGFNVIKSQWAANPKYYHPIPVNETHEITFVGQNYGPRGKIVEFLRKSKIPIETFGRGWGDYLPFEKIISLFSSSKINLNISASSKDERIKQIKGRVFEVPMCGGFLLTDYVEGLEEYFKIGKEIVCYENEKDLVDKIKYFLSHDKERKKIAMNGHRVSLKRHIWEARFKEIFKKLKEMNFINCGKAGIFDHMKNLIIK